MLEGDLKITACGKKKYMLYGFTVEDMRKMRMLVRLTYKLKTKKRRILKKYVSKLIIDSIKNYIKDMGDFNEA